MVVKGGDSCFEGAGAALRRETPWPAWLWQLTVHSCGSICEGEPKALVDCVVAHIWECALVPGVRGGEREQEESAVEHRLM